MQLSQTILHYNEQKLELPAGKMSFFDELYVDYKIEDGPNFQRFQLSIHPKENIVLQQLEIRFYQAFKNTDSIFCNGFQSWSESREYDFQEKFDPVFPLAKNRLAAYGDSNFKSISRGKGHLHSWTYSYLRQANQIQFIGSLNEQAGFTIIQFDQNQKQISIRKDCSGLELGHSFAILDVLIFKGKESDAFEQYFALMEHKTPPLERYTGWSNGQTAQNNSEAYILKNLDLLSQRKYAIDFIQVEDGYQKSIGDWLKINPSFPNGMKTIATQIRAKGFRPAIWIAPFVCEKNSDIFQHQKAWLLKDEKRQAIKAAYHPNTKEALYALDFYNEAFQKYLTGVIFTLLTKWGFDLLKMDFLYAVCLLPRKHKTRGQIMQEAMHFLRELVGEKLSFANAVPLGSSFGQVDFCNVGGNYNVRWENSLQKFLKNRARNTSIVSLRSILTRWQLQGKAFLNTCAAFSLNGIQNKLNYNQQITILIIQSLLGNLLYNADDLAEYSAEQWSEFESIFKWKNSQVQAVQQDSKDVYLIYFNHEGEAYIAACNLASKANILQIKSRSVPLEAYESLILKT